MMPLLLVLLGFLSPDLTPQDLPGAKPRKKGPPAEIRILSIKPEAGKVAFEIEIPKGWHIYPAGKKPLFGSPTVFTFENAEIAGPIVEPAPIVKEEPIVGKTDFHEGTITIVVPIKAGAGEVRGKIDYQICADVCVDGSAPFSFPASTEAPAGGPGSQEKPKKKKLASLSVKAARPEKTSVKVGEVFKVAFDLEMTPGWHIYPTVPTGTGTPTAFLFEGAEVAGRIEEPPAKHKAATKDEAAYDYHEGPITMVVPVRLKTGKPGPVDVKGKIDFQICADLCIPDTTDFAFPMTLLEGKSASAPDVDAIPPPANKGPKELQEGLFKFLLIAVVGGLASLLQPCVFPLLPVTITYFIKQGAGSRSKSIFLAAVYALGLVVSFTTIGILFSLALGPDGARIFATKWYTNVVVAGLFFWFAFSLFGLYDISLPSWLVGSLTNKQRQGAGGSFILGMLFSVVTFTCTVPIAGLILAASASSDAHTRFMGIVGMLVYSSVMAIPFIVMGFFPSLITTVRKSSGDWLHTVKVTMGFVELAVALFYLSKADTVAGVGILTRWVMISFWVATLGFTILYLLRVFQLHGDEADPAPAEDGVAAHPVRRQIGVARMLVALLFGVVAVSFASGYDGRPLGWLDGVLPPNTEAPRPVAGGSPIAEAGISSYPAALEEGKKTGKPIFLEFTGVTCTNCQVMKGTVLAAPAVRALLAQFVFAELYTDRQKDPRHAAGDEENRKLLVEKFEGYALPCYITLGPDGVERSRILGKVSEAEFLEFLKRGLNPRPLPN